MDEGKLHDKTKVFVVNDGTRLESVKDLYGHLSVISDKDFRHHVNESKNDFAAWVEHALGDKFLASAMRQAPTKEEMRKAVFIAMFR